MGRATWVSPYARVWRDEMGLEPAYERMVRYLRPLDKLYGSEKLARALGIYLRDLQMRGEGRFASVARFAQTVKLWLPKEEHTRCVHHPDRAMYAICDRKPLCHECFADT